MISGILNLNKPRGMTSHDVVDIVRRVVGIRKVGHAGTLDPMATGVLLICVGRATRLAEYLVRSQKCYQATARLGVETDTYDADGKVLRAGPVAVERDVVEAALGEFCGSISQVPPMYSAVKQGGQPLHRLARRGVTVERAPRRAFISHISLTDWSPPDFSFRVSCSAGTYVRSLAHDLGSHLGCGAHLTQLLRCRCGQFDIEASLPLGDLTPDNWETHLQPMCVAVDGFPVIILDSGSVTRLTQGQSIRRRPEHPVADLARVDTSDGVFFALVRPSDDGSRWLPHKVLLFPSS